MSKVTGNRSLIRKFIDDTVALFILIKDENVGMSYKAIAIDALS